MGTVYIGTYPYVEGEPFNLSRCRNDGAKAAVADGAEVLLFNDADHLVVREHLSEAIRMAGEDGLVFIGDGYQFLTREQTEAVYEGAELARFLSLVGSDRGGMMVMNCRTFESVGGFDEGYIGWGPEDIDFHHGASLLAPVRRVQGGWYMALWHSAVGNDGGGLTGPAFQDGTPERALFLAGHDRLNRKREVAGSVEQWRAITGAPPEMMRGIVEFISSAVRSN